MDLTMVKSVVMGGSWWELGGNAFSDVILSYIYLRFCYSVLVNKFVISLLWLFADEYPYKIWKDLRI